MIFIKIIFKVRHTGCPGWLSRILVDRQPSTSLSLFSSSCMCSIQVFCPSESPGLAFADIPGSSALTGSCKLWSAPGVCPPGGTQHLPVSSRELIRGSKNTVPEHCRSICTRGGLASPRRSNYSSTVGYWDGQLETMDSQGTCLILSLYLGVFKTMGWLSCVLR